MASIRGRIVGLLLWPAAACAAPAAAWAAPTDAVRAEFRAALDRIGSPEIVADSDALRAYILYPYVEVARLRHVLSRVPRDARDAMLEKSIRAFLEAHRDEPVARELTREWLAYLGERKDWAEFRAAAPEPLTDPALQCYALSARLAAPEDPTVRDAALPLWLTHRDAPEPCRPVFEWLDTAKRLADAEIEQRAINAARLRVPLPKAVADLPPPRRALVQTWDKLMAQPERELRRLLDSKGALPDKPDDEVAAALLEAFSRTSRRDSRQARPLYGPLSQHAALSDTFRAQIQREYALGLAYDFDPEAVAIFRTLPETALDALAHEWRIRAALMQAEWETALRWLEALPAAQKTEVRWRYWRARVLELRGDGAASAAYAEIAKEREYYGFLAAERLGRTPDMRPQPVAEDAKVRDRLLALPGMQRAHELVRCELPDLAAIEFRAALRDQPLPALAQAARIAAKWDWHEQATRLLSELQLWDDVPMRFPLPHAATIDAAAKETGLGPEQLYSVLRTESLYNARAVSKAGALGLLQLRLPTARQVARRAALPRPDRDDLFRPEVNIGLGARYLREMNERFGGRFILTLAAYNAGPQRVPNWLPAAPVEGDVWVENIPYNETRTYVQRALSAQVIYGWRLTGTPGRILPHLAPVQAPAPEKAAPCCGHARPDAAPDKAPSAKPAAEKQDPGGAPESRRP